MLAGVADTRFVATPDELRHLEEAIEACRSAGARIVQERRCYEGAVHYAFVADPDGNEIELAGALA